jgi:hypothetical protein
VSYRDPSNPEKWCLVKGRRLRIQLDKKDIRFLYGVVIVLDVLILFMNTPWMSLPTPPEGQPARLTSVFDFVKYQLDLRTEQNVGTWYSSVILLGAGVMALLNCWQVPAIRKLRWLHRVGWAGMAIVLIGLSADETATIHESLARLFNAMSEAGGRAPSYRVGAGDWIPILLPLMIVVAAGMLAFFLYQFRSNNAVLMLALGGTVFWICALFAESIEAGMTRVVMSRLTEGFIEEGCEVIGTTCLLIAFTEFLHRQQSANDSESSKSKKKFRVAR